MSYRYENRLDVWGKVDAEGGVYEAITSYGIKAGEMPEGDTELAEAWQKAEAAFAEVKPLVRAVEKMLEAAYDAAMEQGGDGHE